MFNVGSDGNFETKICIYLLSRKNLNKLYVNKYRKPYTTGFEGRVILVILANLFWCVSPDICKEYENDISWILNNKVLKKNNYK